MADRILASHSFNVGTAGAKIFTGPAAEEFGYQVQQATNHQGKWYQITDVLERFAHCDCQLQHTVFTSALLDSARGWMRNSS